MINISKIQDSLVGLVGFKQPINPDYAFLNEENQLSSSGYFITDNPFAKVEYLKDTQDYMDIDEDDFNEYLKNIKKSAISSVCNQVFNEFDFIDRSLLFKNASNKIEIENLPIGFIGYKIKVSNNKNVAFNINRVLLDFSGTGEIKLLLWNTSKKTVLQSKAIEITTDHQEEVLEWVIDNSNDTYKGDYYLGYLSKDLTVAPFKRDYENSSLITQPTNLHIEKVKVVNHDDEILFDLNSLDGLSEDTGLNFDITVYDDYTDFVLNNKMLFSRAIYLESVISCIQSYIGSLRSNSNELKSEQLYNKMIVELSGTNDNGVVKVVGLRTQLLGEISTIKKEIEKLKKGFFKSGQLKTYTLR